MKKILVSLSMALMLVMGAKAVANNTTLGPVDDYGFLNAPDGSVWTYTASIDKELWGDYKTITLNVYNDQLKLVGTIVDSLKFTDPYIVAINQAEINPLITQKFFNNDNKYELMLFMHAITKDYEGKFLNHVFSLEEGKTVSTPIATVDGRQVYAQNIGTANEENYVLVFTRDSAKNNPGKYTQFFDVRRKITYQDGNKPYRTFSFPYANAKGLDDFLPFFMIKNGNSVNYVMQQYEKPYFVPGTAYDQEEEISPDNKLNITYMDQDFKTLYTTVLPVVQDTAKQYLYTFPMLGGLGLTKDIVLNYDGNKPAYIITQMKYNTQSDGAVPSFYLYGVNGKLLKTIAENTMGRVKMSPIAGQEDQWMFLKQDYDGEFLFVNLPSCESTTEISVYLEGGDRAFSKNIDRYPKGNSYEYAVALLQGNNEPDGTISQDIAWLNADGSFNRLEKINMGKYIEAAEVYMSSEAFNPHLMHTDDVREYMVLAKRYNPLNTMDKETALLVCNTKGEILLDLGEDDVMGELNTVFLLDKGAKPSILSVYQNDERELTLLYTPLPLNATTDVENIWGDSNTVGGEQNIKKIMIDGQFYILRENGLYRVTGARVK